MRLTIKTEQPTVEWLYRGLFGQVIKQEWVLAPITLTVKDPRTARGVSRRSQRRANRNR
jgi:hypothetical protein